ncbi:MAG: nucleotidyl transferase AbiEii/AbiGii toxin family protein [Pseudomonadota bacterium]
MTDAPRTYATPAAFRQALETRLRRHAEEQGEELMRVRRQVAFDRLLARIFADQGGPWALKGGYALQLRYEEARTTRDVDLSLRTPANLPPGATIARQLQVELQRLGNLDAGDFFDFVVESATLDIDAAPYGGARFPVDARLAGRTFVKFHVDIGIGDPLLEPTDLLTGRDWLGFAGIPAPVFTCISKEQQFAEKLHAYTMPDRPRPNSRVKDLVDMVLMIRRFDLYRDRLVDAIDATFSRRDSHSLPAETLPPPPENWAQPFVALAEETGMEMNANEAFAVLEQYLRSIRNK